MALHGIVALIMSIAPGAYWFNLRFDYNTNYEFLKHNKIYYTTWCLFWMFNLGIYSVPFILFILVVTMKNNTVEKLYYLYYKHLFD